MVTVKEAASLPKKAVEGVSRILAKKRPVAEKGEVEASEGELPSTIAVIGRH